MLLNFIIVTEEACMLGVNGHVCELQLILARYVSERTDFAGSTCAQIKVGTSERSLINLRMHPHFREMMARGCLRP